MQHNDLPETPAKSVPNSGLPLAITAYAIWGLLPLYLRFLRDVPPMELVAWRILFTLPVCFAFIAILRGWSDLRAALANPRHLLTMGLSAMLIGGNWLVYIWAVANGHVLASSLGYYLNPLVNVLLGTAFMGERLSRLQWLAVLLAGIGVLVMLTGGGKDWWISLVLAASFGLYGMVRKLAPVPPLAGLTIEALWLLLPAIGVVIWFAMLPAGGSFGNATGQSLLIAASGIITAVPLLLFATAARRMRYSALGFVQFLAPTMVFIIGITIFKEPLRGHQIASFAMIWGAVALFCCDLLIRSRVAEKAD